MKNANVFVDVDFTITDASGKLLEGAKEALQRLRDEA
jgi:soluble P-type ATPase